MKKTNDDKARGLLDSNIARTHIRAHRQKERKTDG